MARPLQLHALVAVSVATCVLSCKSTEHEVGADAARVKYIGWFDRRSPKSVRFAWPGSQVAVRFRGTGLRVQLTDTPIEDETRETDWLTVVIDGGAPRTIGLREGTHVYELASGLPDSVHNVLLWKRTEAEVGVITLHGFVLLGTDAALQPFKATRRRMVFVGDSITAGYGNEGPDGSCHWSAKLENNFDTYGAYAARELAADYVAAAWSGKGLTRNYEPRDELTLPQLWDRVVPTEADSPRSDGGTADVVVLNLGTNDFFRGIPSEQDFLGAYRALLESVRRRYPASLIVLALGPMLADDHPQPQARSTARRWLERVRAEMLPGGKVASIEFWTDPAEGVGCDFHPNKKTHARMGRELTALIREQLRW